MCSHLVGLLPTQRVRACAPSRVEAAPRSPPARTLFRWASSTELNPWILSGRQVGGSDAAAAQVSAKSQKEWKWLLAGAEETAVLLPFYPVTGAVLFIFFISVFFGKKQAFFFFGSYQGSSPGGSEGKASAYNAEFNPWVAKIPWRRRWHPTPESEVGHC